MGGEIEKELEVKTPIFVTDEKFEDKVACFDWKKNEIKISQPALTSIRDSMRSKGASADEIRQELTRQIIEIVPHEFLHAGQYAKVKNPPRNATSEQLAVIESWRKNFDNYLDISESKKKYGSTNAYAEQPIEKSANNLMTDIERHFQKWRTNRKNVKPSTPESLVKQDINEKKGVKNKG